MYVAILGLVGGRLERGRPEEQSYFRTLQQAMCSLSVQRKPGWTGGARDPALRGLKGGPRTGPLLLYGSTAQVLEADRAGTDACCVTLKRFPLGARRVADAFTSISSLRSLNNLTT